MRKKAGIPRKEKYKTTMFRGLARENSCGNLIKPPTKPRYINYNKTEKQRCTPEIKSVTKTGFPLRSAKLQNKLRLTIKANVHSALWFVVPW